jgi:alpha-tubulin suppressor-like RCC1 family protein
MASASFYTGINSHHIIARLDNGNVVHWGNGGGYNPSGDGTVGDQANEMGDNLTNITAIKLLTRTGGVTQSESWDSATTLSAAGRTISRVCSGYEQTFVILDDGKLLGCGKNAWGVLGRGSSVSHNAWSGTTLTEIELGTVNGDGTGGDLKAVDVSCALYHIAIMTDDGAGNGYKLKCWGYNGNEQLGYENTTNIGLSDDEIGDNLGFVDLGTVNGNGTGGSLTVKAVQCYDHSTAVILSDGGVKIWGYTYYNGSTSLKTGGSSSTMGDNLSYLDLQSGSAEDITFYNKTHANFILLTNGKVLTWGAANWHTGLGSTTEHHYNPYSGGDMTDLGVTGVVSMAVGYNHCGLLFSNGTIKVCGNNGQGQWLQGNATQNYTSSQTWANANTVNLGSGRSVHSGNYKYSFQASGYSLFVLLDNETLGAWGHGYGSVLGHPYNGSTHYGDGAGETTPLILDLGTSRTLKWEIKNPDSLSTSVVNAISDSTNGIRTGVVATRNANFLTLAKSYRDDATATTITEAENTKRRKQLRREMRLALGSDDNVSYTDSTDKTNLIATSSSSNTGLIDTSFPLQIFFPDPDNSSTIDMSSVDFDSTNIYIDLVASEAITVTTNTGSQTWTMNSDGDGVTVINESSVSTAYALGGTVSVGSYSIKLFMFGSVGGGSASSGGDPYVCPMIGEPYKLPDGKKYFRLFDTNINDSNDRLLLNCFADYCSNTDNEQNYIDKRVKDYNLEKLYVNQKNLKDLTFYKYGYIQYGQNSIYIDMYDLKLYNRYKSMELKENELTEDEYPEWLTVDYNNKYTQYTLLSKITKIYNFEESRYMKVSIKTESHGNCSFKFHKYVNPQIRTGVLFRIEKTNNISGALVRQLSRKDVILKKLTDKKYIKDVNFKPNKNRIITEIFYDKSNRDKIKILSTDTPSKTDRFYAKFLM